MGWRFCTLTFFLSSSVAWLSFSVFWTESNLRIRGTPLRTILFSFQNVSNCLNNGLTFVVTLSLKIARRTPNLSDGMYGMFTQVRVVFRPSIASRVSSTEENCKRRSSRESLLPLAWNWSALFLIFGSFSDDFSGLGLQSFGVWLWQKAV